MNWISAGLLCVWSTVLCAARLQPDSHACQWISQTEAITLSFVPGEIKGLCATQALDRGFYAQPDDWLIAMYAGKRVPEPLRRQRARTYVRIAPATLFPAPGELVIHFKNGKTTRVLLAPRQGHPGPPVTEHPAAVKEATVWPLPPRDGPWPSNR